MRACVPMKSDWSLPSEKRAVGVVPVPSPPGQLLLVGVPVVSEAVAKNEELVQLLGVITMGTGFHMTGC
jgi:hypothetical protein